MKSLDTENEILNQVNGKKGAFEEIVLVSGALPDARSRIIENNLWGCFFPMSRPSGGSNPTGPYSNPFITLRG